MEAGGVVLSILGVRRGVRRVGVRLVRWEEAWGVENVAFVVDNVAVTWLLVLSLMLMLLRLGVFVSDDDDDTAFIGDDDADKATEAESASLGVHCPQVGQTTKCLEEEARVC